MGDGFRVLDAQLERMRHKLRRLESLSRDGDAYVAAGMRELHRKYDKLLSVAYRDLSAWDVVQIARHPKRPGLMDYLGLMARDSIELHGDRLYGDDKAIVTAFARIGLRRVLIVVSGTFIRRGIARLWRR